MHHQSPDWAEPDVPRGCPIVLSQHTCGDHSTQPGKINDILLFFSLIQNSLLQACFWNFDGGFGHTTFTAQLKILCLGGLFFGTDARRPVSKYFSALTDLINEEQLAIIQGDRTSLSVHQTTRFRYRIVSVSEPEMSSGVALHN